MLLRWSAHRPDGARGSSGIRKGACPTLAGIESHRRREPAQNHRVTDDEELGGPDYGAVMADMDARLADTGDGWADQPEGQMYLQSLAAALVPLAGLDLDAVRASARTFLVNFPSVSLPFGDVDERAANWLARLHDSPAVRASLHELLVRLGETWEADHPLAAEQARRWGAGPVVDDPTADAPWMRALVALVRTEL